MKAFWWYKDDLIAGMGRPGFNSVRWFDLPFDEAVLLGWLGQYSDDALPIAALRHHISTYVPRIFKFHKLTEQESQHFLINFESTQGIRGVFERLNTRLPILSSFEVINDVVHIQMNTHLLDTEIDHLKSHNIKHVITLTERHHHKDRLQKYFSTYHISIADLGAPTRDQVFQLSEIIKSTGPKKEKMAVHCLAGIGRTSTMILGAHILLGEKFQDLEPYIAKRNPAFSLTGPQAEFLKTLK